MQLRLVRVGQHSVLQLPQAAVVSLEAIQPLQDPGGLVDSETATIVPPPEEACLERKSQLSRVRTLQVGRLVAVLILDRLLALQTISRRVHLGLL